MHKCHPRGLVPVTERAAASHQCSPSAGAGGSRGARAASPVQWHRSSLAQSGLEVPYLWYWFCRNWNSSLIRSKVSG